ncbi:hypothetical protein LEP1GSC013_1287 [Leptospira interrogans serovar Valbuzzi str. Duyster]|nr:hypothetical protein LEP1GSC013_1287 [Leptospira interrogans serovar Valbuzzi str. Duyster]
MDCWSSNLPYNGHTLKDNIKQMENCRFSTEGSFCGFRLQVEGFSS